MDVASSINMGIGASTGVRAPDWICARRFDAMGLGASMSTACQTAGR